MKHQPSNALLFLFLVPALPWPDKSPHPKALENWHQTCLVRGKHTEAGID